MIARLANAPSFVDGGFLQIVDGDGLEYVGPEGLLTDEIRGYVQQHKAEIIAWLRTPADDLPEEDQLLFDYVPNLDAWWGDDSEVDARRQP